MNYYIYNFKVFDNNKGKLHLKKLFCNAYAESRNEAQRQIVDKMLAPDGRIGQFITPNDPFDRFRLVFDDEPLVEDEVIWNEELNQWEWAIPH